MCHRVDFEEFIPSRIHSSLCSLCSFCLAASFRGRMERSKHQYMHTYTYTHYLKAHIITQLLFGCVIQGTHAAQQTSIHAYIHTHTLPEGTHIIAQLLFGRVIQGTPTAQPFQENLHKIWIEFDQGALARRARLWRSRCSRLHVKLVQMNVTSEKAVRTYEHTHACTNMHTCIARTSTEQPDHSCGCA